jgi:hypothetical protein
MMHAFIFCGKARYLEYLLIRPSLNHQSLVRFQRITAQLMLVSVLRNEERFQQNF